VPLCKRVTLLLCSAGQFEATRVGAATRTVLDDGTEFGFLLSVQTIRVGCRIAFQCSNRGYNRYPTAPGGLQELASRNAAFIAHRVPSYRSALWFLSSAYLWILLMVVSRVVARTSSRIPSNTIFLVRFGITLSRNKSHATAVTDFAFASAHYMSGVVAGMTRLQLNRSANGQSEDHDCNCAYG
jgi:hypothetical protein